MHNTSDSTISRPQVSALLNPALSMKGGQTSGAIIDGEPYNAVGQEQAMWRAVVVQALMDAACGSQKYEAAQARNEALIWLRGTSQDFATVCYYAGFEPEFVRRMVRNSLENGCQWRALPGEGKRVRHTRPRSVKRRASQRR